MIAYQKLTKKELDTFIQMRIRQLREEGATEDIDLVPALQDYYNRHMSDGTFVSWLAMDGDIVICGEKRMNAYFEKYHKKLLSQLAIDLNCNPAGKSLWLRNCPDYGIGYGSSSVYGFWFREEREFYAVKIIGVSRWVI